MLHYDFIADGYNELYAEEQLNKVSIIKNYIKADKDAKLLDVGCGTGISSNFECFAVGIDPSFELLKRNKRIMRIMGLAESLPFKDNSFDFIISITAMHNFKNLRQSASEIKRVGKKNFVFSVLKKSGKFSMIMNLIKQNFKTTKEIDEGKDRIIFCQKP